MNTNRLVIVGALVSLVGTAVWFLEGGATHTASGEGLVGASSLEPTKPKQERPPKSIRTRPVSSAAQPDFEGGEPDDWDTLDTQGRIARTEAEIAALMAQIAGATDSEEKRRLEEKAQETLAFARADFFLQPDTTMRYIELEASLEGP